MSTIIAQPGRLAHPEPGPHPDALARQRRDLLARASAQDMETALTFLGMIDPEAFAIALTAVASRTKSRTNEIPDDADLPQDAATFEDEEPFGDEEPFPVCRQCGAPVAIFPDRSLQWQHFRGDSATSGTQEIFDPGHPAEAGWLLPGEDPADL